VDLPKDDAVESRKSFPFVRRRRQIFYFRCFKKPIRRRASRAIIVEVVAGAASYQPFTDHAFAAPSRMLTAAMSRPRPYQEVAGDSSSKNELASRTYGETGDTRFAGDTLGPAQPRSPPPGRPCDHRDVSWT